MEDTTTFLLLGFYGALLLLDVVAPARKLPEVRFWRAKGLAAFVVYVAVALTAPALWDATLAEFRLFDLTGLGTWWGALVGIVAIEGAQYAYHRLAHGWGPLWQASHQFHHSAERIDAFGAFWFHPIDMVGFTFVTSLALVLGVGLTPDAVAIAGAVMTGLAIFQHANLRTPKWVGWFVHRPEQHGLHHERGLHAFNYGSITLFDLLFGTFRNPATWDEPAGFYDGASSRLGDMLLGRDVTTPKAAAIPASGDRPSREPRLAA